MTCTCTCRIMYIGPIWVIPTHRIRPSAVFNSARMFNQLGSSAPLSCLTTTCCQLFSSMCAQPSLLCLVRGMLNKVQLSTKVLVILFMCTMVRSLPHPRPLMHATLCPVMKCCGMTKLICNSDFVMTFQFPCLEQMKQGGVRSMQLPWG